MRQRKVKVEKIDLVKQKQHQYGPAVDTLEKLFEDEIVGASKYACLHFNVPASCKLSNGEVPEEFAQKVSTLRWKDILTCLICTGLRFDNILDMKKHQIEVHNTRTYIFGCHICKSGVLTTSKCETILMNHLVERHFFEHLKFCCMVCSKMFYDLRSLHHHYKTHDGGLFTLNCFICGFTAQDLESLKCHKAKHVMKPKSETIRLCEKIQDKFDRGIIENPENTSIPEHERNPDGTVSEECQQRLAVDWSFGHFQCTPCSLVFSTPFDLLAHSMRVHSRQKNARNETIKKGYCCKACDKRKTFVYSRTFDQFFTFINHAIDERHCDNIEFSCTICLKVFWNLRALKVHYNEVHPTFKLVFCNHCGKIFQGYGSAALHYNNEVAEEDEKVVRESKTKVFHCAFCNYSSTTKGSLVGHFKYVHKLVDPEQMSTCEICGVK